MSCDYTNIVDYQYTYNYSEVFNDIDILCRINYINILIYNIKYVII